MAADRAQHVDEVLVPTLAEGRWVVTDRYSGSTVAYQGWGRELGAATLAPVLDFAAGGLAADLAVLVDVPLDLARERLPRWHRTDSSASTRASTTVCAGDSSHRRPRPAALGVVDGAVPSKRWQPRSRPWCTSVWARPPGLVVSPTEDTAPPVPELFAGVVGQPAAVRALRAAARRPCTPTCSSAPGIGWPAGRPCFAAALLCPFGGCGRCDTCRRALAAPTRLRPLGAHRCVGRHRRGAPPRHPRPAQAFRGRPPDPGRRRRPPGPALGSGTLEDGRRAPGVDRLHPLGRRPPARARHRRQPLRRSRLPAALERGRARLAGRPRHRRAACGAGGRGAAGTSTGPAARRRRPLPRPP